jgi:L-lactate dehydrogenase complex protein LldE
MHVDVPLQSCCGQPAITAGIQCSARAVARNVIATFEPYDFIVRRRGPCARHDPRSLPAACSQGDDAWSKRADRAAKKRMSCFRSW